MRSILTTTMLAAPLAAADAVPPAARVEPHKLEHHGQTRVDNYYWLRDRSNPATIEYLKAENVYTDALTAHTAPLRKKLFDEFVGRIRQTDSTAPYRKDGFWYYRRTESGKQYPIYCRKKSLDGPEQVIIDVNKEAEGHAFTSIPTPSANPAGRIAVYGIDTTGRRFYTLRFKNLDSGELLPDAIENTTGNVAWANDNQTLFYVRQHPETLRAYRVFRHKLGADPAADALVYEETDETFRVGVGRTTSGKFLLIHSSQTLSDEVRVADASTPNASFRVLAPRKRDHEYSVDHAAGRFFIRTNLGGKNFEVRSAAEDAKGVEDWRVVVPHRADTFVDDFTVFASRLVVSERRQGLLHLHVMEVDGKNGHYVPFDEPAYVAGAADNHDENATTLRFRYESMATPPSVFDYDMAKRTRTLVKQDEVGGGFDAANYRTERIWATAPDGVKVPISLVYRRDRRQPGKNPLLLSGYGSYGAPSDPYFGALVISLLDRGFVHAIAHIRGGSELGREWYEAGKLYRKKNTFTDFIAAADHLIAEKYADPQRVFAIGGSAGGLLMGAVINLRPALFKGVIAAVPFVDVVTTMLDSSIPLTTNEYDEWGNPNQRDDYDYMLSYSPYDQVKAQEYPNLLVTTGLEDSQVQYWEPAKWVAKLRAVKTGSNKILLKTEMAAGHGGPSGRYKSYEDRAFNYAFLLDLAGVKD